MPTLADFPSTEALTEQPRESQLLPWRNGRQFWRDADAILVAFGPAGGLAAGTVRGTGRLLVDWRIVRIRGHCISIETVGPS